ncbi:MAG: hypothetical protein ACREE6_18395 [Limisphaerales bacterium]
MQNKLSFYSAIPLFPSNIRSAWRMAMLSGAFVAALAAAPCRAQDPEPGDSGRSFVDYFADWFPRVTQIQNEQPHWITPLVTVTPRLEEELRYDQSWTTMNSAGNPQVNNYGSTKGLELIPFDPVEVIIGIPGYETWQNQPSKHGWSDETFLVKYRVLSGNEANGNYILTAFMGLSVPSGSDGFSSHHYAFTPTIAVAKGWGGFDLQSTLGLSVPDKGFAHDGAGSVLAWNTAFQYRLHKIFWPEVEANYTWWPSGEHEGLNQLLVTPGIVIGRVPIEGRLGLTFGAGCEFQVTGGATVRRNVILSCRIPF